jgi:heptosyltransferase-3
LKQHGFTPVQEEAILYPAAKDVQTAKALLQQEGWQPGIPLIAVVVGAKRPQNRWPIGYFKQVVEHITNRYQVVLAGSQEDNELVRPLMDIRQVINACGRLTPMESAALLSLCTLTISNDTGPMHLSYGVGTPTIALFSSRDLPGKWYPPLDRNVFFRTPDVPCQACFSETCNNNICMQAISPEQVIAEAENLLEQEIKAR